MGQLAWSVIDKAEGRGGEGDTSYGHHLFAVCEVKLIYRLHLSIYCEVSEDGNLTSILF